MKVSGAGELILLIEDEAQIAEFLQTALQKNGYRVIAAGNGLKGLEAFTAHSSEVKLIITDNNMPGMTGLEMVRRIRQLNSNVKILVISGVANSEVLEAFQQAGVTDFLVKPFVPSQLVTVASRVLSAERDGAAGH